MSELCKGSVNGLTVYANPSDSPVTLNFQGVSGLASITQGLFMDCGPFAQLAFLNASTLRTLDIGVATEADWLSLIRGDTDTPAVFGSLTALTLTTPSIPYTTTWHAIEDAAPFPILSTLAIQGGYAFDDDLLFKGNGATLQSLYIPFAAIARDFVGRFKVFKRSGTTLMGSICIGRATDADKVFIAERVEVPIKQQLHEMLEATKSLTLSDAAGVEDDSLPIISAIYAAPNSATLWHLEFTNLVFDLCHIIRVIAALPSLVSFTCAVRGLSSSIGDIPANERPSSLRTTHNLLSSNFKVLRVSSTDKSTANNIAIVAMQIAVLCPNFVRVDVPPKLRSEFSVQIAWAICNDSFGPYADSLQRLIYRDLNG
ncbi:hypothetical protein GGH95_003551 [Coemansia sp. RSA 1836]|nr:hypothetical protein GGH95_003551 [Coemansia sp. RSA 1836]